MKLNIEGGEKIKEEPAIRNNDVVQFGGCSIEETFHDCYLNKIEVKKKEENIEKLEEETFKDCWIEQKKINIDFSETGEDTFNDCYLNNKDSNYKILEDTGENYDGFINVAIEKEENSNAVGNIQNLYEKINISKDNLDNELRLKNEERNAVDEKLKTKFNEVLLKNRDSEEYKQSLGEYNELQNRKRLLDEQINDTKQKLEILNSKRHQLRDLQIKKGTEIIKTSTVTISDAHVLMQKYEQAFENTDGKKELQNIRNDSGLIIQKLLDEKNDLEYAIDAKMDEISEYIKNNNMKKFESSQNLQYKKFVDEYDILKERCKKISYCVIKLDENNKEITEKIGDEYVSMIDFYDKNQKDEFDLHNYKAEIDKITIEEISIEKKLQELEKKCEDNDIVRFVDYHDFTPEVAEAMTDALLEAKRDFPELNINYVGTIDSQVKGIHNTIAEMYETELRKLNGDNFSDEEYQLAARAYADNYIESMKLNDTDHTFAWSLKIPSEYDPTAGGLTKFNGVAINNCFAEDNELFTRYKMKEVETRHKPIGCGTPKATADHEIGHEIDKILNASSDMKINEMYKKMVSEKNAREMLSGYSETNVKEFIAEAYSEYRNNTMPREYAREVYKRLIELRNIKGDVKRE